MINKELILRERPNVHEESLRFTGEDVIFVEEVEFPDISTCNIKKVKINIIIMGIK